MSVSSQRSSTAAALAPSKVAHKRNYLGRAACDEQGGSQGSSKCSGDATEGCGMGERAAELRAVDS